MTGQPKHAHELLALPIYSSMGELNPTQPTEVVAWEAGTVMFARDDDGDAWRPVYVNGKYMRELEPWL